MYKRQIENKFPQWNVLEAANAPEALKLSLYENEKIDLITLDMNMPGIDGLTVAPQLQGNCSNAVIALLTGNVQGDIKTKAEKQGLVFIPKPITEDKIIEFIMAYNSN